MQFLGSENFYAKLKNLKRVHNLLHDDVKFQCTPEMEKLFQDVKMLNAINADTKLIKPIAKHPFFITTSQVSSVDLRKVLSK